MYSWAAIWASVRPWATRVTSSRSRALSCPRPGAAGAGCGRRGGEHQGVLGRGGQAHRRAAFLGRAGPAGSERLPGLRAAVPPGGAIQGGSVNPSCRVERGVRGPHGDGLGVAPGRGAQVPAAVQAVEQLIPAAGPHGDLESLPAGAPRRRRSRPARRSRSAICGSRTAWFHRSPASRARASPAAQTRSAAARSPASISTPVNR